MIELLSELLFYAAMLLLAVTSLVMVYVLLRFGQSKLLGLVLSALYVFIMLGLFAAALANFNQIPFWQ